MHSDAQSGSCRHGCYGVLATAVAAAAALVAAATLAATATHRAGGKTARRQLGLPLLPPRATVDAGRNLREVVGVDKRKEVDKTLEARSARSLQNTIPYNWKLVREEAAFSARYAHAAVMNANQEIFIIGGATADLSSSSHGKGMSHGYLNDVWVSSDQGRSWSEVVPRSPRFDPRRGHAVTLDSKRQVMFLLGGFCGQACLRRDWWNSETGSIWESMGQAPWSARHGHAAVVTSKDRLLLLGGHDGSHYLNDIWIMQDPAQPQSEGSWVRATDSAPWSPRYGHAVVVNSLDTVFLMGGYFEAKQFGRVACFNDVWLSDDGGYSWTLVVEHAPWSGRYQHTGTVNTKDELFILGGLSLDLERCGDVWRSEDSGQTWSLVTPAAPWAARYEHAVVSDLNNSLYVLGGMSSSDEKFHDVWLSERTCADDIRCSGDTMVCRDGTDENFEGMPNPVCVGICDHRIFNKCSHREACQVVNQKAVCVNPCHTKTCGGGEVCEVAPRGRSWKGELLSDAEAYCLACDSAKSQFTCDKLKQCQWRQDDEACKMRCTVMKSAKVCKADKHCKWDKDTCAEVEED